MVKVANEEKKILKKFKQDGYPLKDLPNLNINMEVIYFFKHHKDIGNLYKDNFRAMCYADYVFVDNKCIKSRDGCPAEEIFENVFKKFSGVIMKRRTKKHICNCHLFDEQVCDVCQNTINKVLKDIKL